MIISGVSSLVYMEDIIIRVINLRKIPMEQDLIRIAQLFPKGSNILSSHICLYYPNRNFAKDAPRLSL